MNHDQKQSQEAGRLGCPDMMCTHQNDQTGLIPEGEGEEEGGRGRGRERGREGEGGGERGEVVMVGVIMAA